MEDYSPTPKKKWNLTTLAFLEIGIFEFFFVAVVLFLLFGTLNYFNILPVSDVFPNQLSWLPRQTSQPKKLLYTPANPTPKPTTTPTTAAFSYDTKKAQALLTQYIKDNIKPEFLPAKIEVKQKTISNTTNKEVPYEFNSFFTIRKDEFLVALHYKENTNTLNDFIVQIQPSKIDVSTTSVSLANSLVSAYFINPYVITTCNAKGLVSYCEEFRIENQGKKGFGISLSSDTIKSTVVPLVISCFISKTSDYYSTQKTCLPI